MDAFDGGQVSVPGSLLVGTDHQNEFLFKISEIFMLAHFPASETSTSQVTFLLALRLTGATVLRSFTCQLV